MTETQPWPEFLLRSKTSADPLLRGAAKRILKYFGTAPQHETPAKLATCKQFTPEFKQLLREDLALLKEEHAKSKFVYACDVVDDYKPKGAGWKPLQDGKFMRR